MSMDLRWIIDLRIHGVTLCEKCIARALTKGRLILEILHAYDDPGNTGDDKVLEQSDGGCAQ